MRKRQYNLIDEKADVFREYILLLRSERQLAKLEGDLSEVTRIECELLDVETRFRKYEGCYE